MRRQTVTIVNSVRPSSGWWRCFPLSTVTNSGSRPGVPLPPTSPLSRICPRRRGGSPPGDVVAPPVLSLRGWGPTALSWSPSTGRMREGVFPPGNSNGRRCHIVDVVRLVYAIPFCFPTLGRGPGFCVGPAYPRPGLNSMFPADT